MNLTGTACCPSWRAAIDSWHRQPAISQITLQTKDDDRLGPLPMMPSSQSLVVRHPCEAAWESGVNVGAVLQAPAQHADGCHFTCRRSCGVPAFGVHLTRPSELKRLRPPAVP